MHWAIARYDLGLSEAEFWRITPMQLDALYGRHAQARSHLEVLAGTIASAVANFGYARPKKWVTPHDFGLGPKRKGAREEQNTDAPLDNLPQLQEFLFPKLTAKRKAAKNG